MEGLEGLEVVEGKEDKKVWWLMTNNFLIPYKGYFSTREEAVEKLKFLLSTSKPYFTARLSQEAEEEVQLNSRNFKRNPDTYSERKKARNFQASFKGYTIDNLECSVKLLIMNDFKRKKDVFIETVTPE